MNELIEKFLSVLCESTETAGNMFEMESKVSGREKVQKLFDMSTFDCNKPIIAELFKIASGNTEMFQGLDTKAETRLNILYPVGSVVCILKKHDWHTYEIGDYAVITGHRSLTKGKVTMETLDPKKMDKGSNLYHYDLWEYLAFMPTTRTGIENMVAKYFLPKWDTLECKKWVQVVMKGDNDE